MKENLLRLNQVTVKSGGVPILDKIDLSIQKGEQWLIAGPAGSGKTSLAYTLLGRHFYSGSIDFNFGMDNKTYRVGIVEQQRRFKNLSHTNDFYYQQRFNASDADQTITVEEEFGERILVKNRWEDFLLDRLGIRNLLSKPQIQLSNGENKRVQLAIALASEPELLILDNPFLGLDAEGRETLGQILDDLIQRGIHILLIGSPSELPSLITHIAWLEKGKLIFAGEKKAFHLPSNTAPETGLDPEILKRLRPVNLQSFSLAVKMVDLSIEYGDKPILNHIDWEVKKGERWAITGPNGAGKSTLLSLVTGDNPQAYAKDLYLFDRRRGTGESIWDIKKMIGFVSPELHLFFNYGSTCFEVVASGLFDTIGLFRQLNKREEEITLLWIGLLHLTHLSAKRLDELSTGQQRMILLARALVKNPSMLILDEPCQGLDAGQIFHFKNLVDSLCFEFETTLIYVSHYPEHIPACIDHFLKLEQGFIIP